MSNNQSDFELKCGSFSCLNYFHIDEFIQEYGIEAFPSKTINKDEFFKEIETALGFKLSDIQRLYISDNSNQNIYTGRSNGKLVAHYIKLALSEGDPISIKRFPLTDLPELLSWDNTAKNFNYWDYKEKYCKLFIDIWLKLKKYGFNVRQIVH